MSSKKSDQELTKYLNELETNYASGYLSVEQYLAGIFSVLKGNSFEENFQIFGEVVSN